MRRASGVSSANSVSRSSAPGMASICSSVNVGAVPSDGISALAKSATLEPRAFAICASREKLIRFAPFSYFWIYWNEIPHRPASSC